MKLLLLILMLTGCKLNEAPKAPVIAYECKGETCNEEVDEPIEESVENNVGLPFIEEKPYFYNHSLYFKAFTFWGLNFVSDDRINNDKQNVFTSSNTIQTTVGSQFKTVYGKIFFKNGESVKINYYNNSTHTLELSYERDWIVYDDFEFHIDGYKQGEFAWHSRIHPTMKNDNEVDDGVEKYERTDNVWIEEICYTNILFQTECVNKYLSTDIYSRYYFN